MVGGLYRVYEIKRNFRNEGISSQHNPEFTMLEFYEAYSNYHDLMTLNEELLAQLAVKITGSTTVKYGEVEVDFGNMERLTMRGAIAKYWPQGAGDAPTVEDLGAPGAAKAATERYNAWAKIAHAPYAAAKGTLSEGEWTGLLFETIAEEKLIQPTILYDFPTDISPLSKQKPEDPSLTERFEIYVAGMEIANGFSELNDPVEQERRFRRKSPAVAKTCRSNWMSIMCARYVTDCHRRPARHGAGSSDHAAHRLALDSRGNSVSAIALGSPRSF